MENTAFLKLGYTNGLTGQHAFIIVNLSRFFQKPQKQQNKNKKNRSLKAGVVLARNFGPFTLFVTCFLVFLLLVSPVVQANRPDIAIQISPSHMQVLVESSIPSNIPLNQPADTVFRVNSAQLSGAVPSITISGVLVQPQSSQHLPVIATADFSIEAHNQSILIRPSLRELRIETEEIPFSKPLTLIKAWLLSLSAEKPDLSPILVPIQTQLKLAGSELNVRSRENFGSATAEVVASLATTEQLIDMVVADAKLQKGALIVALNVAANGGSSKNLNYPNIFLRHTDSLLFLSGKFFADFLNRAAGKIETPFHLENPQGKIDGDSSNTLLGRKEWYIRFQGNKPIAGHISIDSNFVWKNQLNYNSAISLAAQGKIHAHGDPGPGGGCGVRPGVQVNGKAQVSGLIDVSSSGDQVQFSLLATNQPKVRLQYHVNRVNICSVVTKGPYRGNFDVAIPNTPLRTSLTFLPLELGYRENNMIKLSIDHVATTSEGYLISLQVTSTPNS